MKKVLFICLLFIGVLTSINAEMPSRNFMNLPLSWVHPIEGTEWVANNPETIDVSVAEFIKFGLNPKAILTWEKLETDQYILNMLIKDRMTGNSTNIKMLFIKKNTPIRGENPSPERVLLSRIIINNNENNRGQIFKFALDTCNRIMVLHKTKKTNHEQGLPESMTQYWEGSKSSISKKTKPVNLAEDISPKKNVITEVHYSPQYKLCMDRSGGVTSELRSCNGAELKYQDKLLNKYYKQAMKVLDDKHKKELKKVQRQWIKYRDAKCDFLYGLTGGTMDLLMGGSCYVDMTAKRAEELKDIVAMM